jgi:hypothetical protein
MAIEGQQQKNGADGISPILSTQFDLEVKKDGLRM